jgi:glycosyltransferase involved in cell wall biosynthesis
MKTYPNALIVLANANGNYHSQIEILLQDIPQKNYAEISFEPQIFDLYQIFDIFVHVPISPSIEAFGQTYVEALAAGIPSIFTLSGVASEFVIHHQNAWVVPFKDSEAIYEAILEILNNKSVRESVVNQGRQDVQQKFNLEQMINKLAFIYEQQ